MHLSTTRYHLHIIIHSNNITLHNCNTTLCNHNITLHSITRHLSTTPCEEIELDTEVEDEIEEDLEEAEGR